MSRDNLLSPTGFVLGDEHGLGYGYEVQCENIWHYDKTLQSKMLRFQYLAQITKEILGTNFMKIHLFIALFVFFPLISSSSGKEPLKCSSSKEGILIFSIPKEYVNRKKLTALYVTDSNFSYKWRASLRGEPTNEMMYVYYGKGWKKADGTFVGLQTDPEDGKAVKLNANEEVCFGITFIHDTFPFNVGNKSINWVITIPKKGNQSEGKECNEKEFQAWRSSKKKPGIP